MRATAILPVKRFAQAKRRLADSIGPPARAALLKAMLADVLAALDGAIAIERVIVVTGEGRAEAVALDASRTMTTELEVLQDPDDHGHSEAAVLGIVRAKAHGAGCAALLPGDCPLLDAGELDQALEAVTEGSVGVIPDRHGTGTNGLLLSPADAIGPAFGEGSCERHLDRGKRAGYRSSPVAVRSLALDLDTPDDLVTLRATLASAPHRARKTAAVLAQLP